MIAWTGVETIGRCSPPESGKFCTLFHTYMAFPKEHWAKLHSTNPIERLNKEVKRRADVVGIFPNEASIRRLVGAILLEQNDEWQLQHRYMSLETMAGLADEAATPPKIAA